MNRMIPKLTIQVHLPSPLSKQKLLPWLVSPASSLVILVPFLKKEDLFHEMLQSVTPSETTIPCNVKAIAMYLLCKTCLISGDVTTLDDKFFMQLITHCRETIWR